MNRSTYFNLCEEKLSFLCTRVELRGKLNLLDLHLHCEDFYVHFFNLLFGYVLKNVNQYTLNAEGIDLIDSVQKVVLQVSSTATKQKIESALSKNLTTYRGYSFKFISISKDASALRRLSYKNPHSLVFEPIFDIHDVRSLLDHILHLDIVKQQAVYEFLSKELSSVGVKNPLTETNIAAVINILAKENLSDMPSVDRPTPFNVDEKLVFNDLNTAAMVVEDYKIHHGRLSRIYAEFDVAGQNKSKSVLDSLRNSYIKLCTTYSADELFFNIVDRAVTVVKQSANYVSMPLEELELCVNVIVVDAFIRCSIFKNPKGIENVVA
ncbi:ABC-three component system protein [Photorhabdus laumondii]|uniref:ABC-three component system protein n=1 Tax=Photorhabdus laumondii TaxID=2218628 RepID=UPI0025AF6909|nr:ABC-three component system protein [Photorhabdus laumondii]